MHEEISSEEEIAIIMGEVQKRIEECRRIKEEKHKKIRPNRIALPIIINKELMEKITKEARRFSVTRTELIRQTLEIVFSEA